MNQKRQLRSCLMRRISADSTEREILFGTSRFHCLLAANVGLSVEGTASSLYLLNLFLEQFSFEKVERKIASAACVLLSWKVFEDKEDQRCSRKLQVLSRLFFRLNMEDDISSFPMNLNHRSSNSVTGSTQFDTATTAWLYNDSGSEMASIRSRIKSYEAAVLRVVHFDVESVPLPFKKIHFLSVAFSSEVISMEGERKPSLRLLNFDKTAMAEDSSVRVQVDHVLLEQIHSLSRSIALDAFRFPLCLEHSKGTLAAACVLKASITLGSTNIWDLATSNLDVDWLESVGTTFSEVQKALHDIRILYGWIKGALLSAS
eukprot:GHVP01036713.1.p1 GENE.GHVP01036713.1~~GHVP01036713.1.p1  ORF type:complete len:317 (-),score=51.51 GHVP01036713.1:839-1789(-)